MRQAVRAIIVRDDKLLVMQRNKFGNIYYTLIGGGIDEGETPKQAVVREVAEETGLVVKPETVRLVFMHEAGEPFGTQHIFTCEAIGSDVQLRPDSEEAAIHSDGQNLFTPMWLPIDEIPKVPFRSEQMAKAIYAAIKHGFASEPKTI
jgi:8-oxo-dGTP pyrophosphatase MutT (NUDIX family)